MLVKMSQGVRYPQPFPQFVGSPPQYKTAKTYAVLYGEIVNLQSEGYRAVVGTIAIDGTIAAPFGRAPAVSNKKPADPYLILDAGLGVPKDAYNRPLPVKYGDRITLKNMTTGDFWQVTRGALLGSGNRLPPAVFKLVSSEGVPPGSGVSGYVAGTTPFNFPQPNSFLLESVYGPVGMIGPETLGISVPNGGITFSVILTDPAPYPEDPSRTEIVSVDNRPFKPNPYFYFPEHTVSPIYPSRLSRQSPRMGTQIYNGPLPPN